MKTQIVYVLVSTDTDLFLEELWASLYSLRIYHPEVPVRVLADAPTALRINDRPQLANMINDVITVDVPDHYSSKERSRQIKTSVRNIINGNFFYIDTDTIICRPLDDIDALKSDIAAVPDGHMPLPEHAFRNSVIHNVKRIYGVDISDNPSWFNAGVLYVADNKLTRSFFRKWNEHWTFSSFQKGCSQDMPAFGITDRELGYIIKPLPDIYNFQIALSLKHYADAAIVHFWHMDFIADQSYSPFMGLSAYREIKEHGCITPHVEELIRHCKSSFASPTTVIGIKQIQFLFSPTGQAFSQLRQESRQWAKVLDWIAGKIIRFRRGIRKIHKIIKKEI